MNPLSTDTIGAMLAHLSPDMPRDEWAAVLMALKSELGETGFDLADIWSARGEKYRAADVRSTWRSIKAGGGVTAGTLVHMAKAAGWRTDAVQAPAPSPSNADLAAAAAADARRKAADLDRQRQVAQQIERASHAAEQWAAGADTGAAPYLDRKGLSGPHGARFAPGGVLRVPMRDAAGELWNVQDILPDKMRDRATGEPTTDKLYAAGKGARKAGLFHLIGEPAGADVLLIGEGFATCGSVFEATGRPVAVAFDAGNLAPVARELRRLHPAALLLLVADNDRTTEATTGRNPGREAADKVARAVRGAAVWPEPGELPEGGSDWNDVAQHAGLAVVRDRIEAAIQAAMQAAKAAAVPPAPANRPARAATGRPGADPARGAATPPPRTAPVATGRTATGRDTRAARRPPGTPADAGGELADRAGSGGNGSDAPGEADEGDPGDEDDEPDCFSLDGRGV